MLSDVKKTKGDEAWNSSFWLKELAQISSGNELKSIFWETGEHATPTPTMGVRDLTTYTDEDADVKSKQQKQQERLENDKRDFTFDRGFPPDKSLARASQHEKYTRFTETPQPDFEDEDDESVEQITISLSALMSNGSQQESTHPHQIERIECTFEDLVLGEESEKIRDLLVRLSGKKRQSRDEGASRDVINRMPENHLEQQVVEEFEKNPNIGLNAFASSSRPSHSPSSCGSMATNEDANSSSSSSQSGEGEDKLNAFAPAFIPSSSPAVVTPVLSETRLSGESRRSSISVSTTAAASSIKLNPFSLAFVPPSQTMSSSSSFSSIPTATTDSTAPNTADYSQSSLNSLFAPPKFFHSSSVTTTDPTVLIPQQHQHWSVLSSQYDNKTITTSDRALTEQAHIAFAPTDTVYFTTNAASVADLP